MFKVDTSELVHRGKRIDWINSVGKSIKFTDEDGEEYVLKIVGYDKKTRCVSVNYNGENCKIFSGHLLECKIYTIIGKRIHEYKFDIGEIINSIHAKVVKQIRYNRNKGYVLQCLVDGYQWKAEEANIVKGKSCPVCAGKTTLRGINDIATIRPYLIKYFYNINDTYTHTVMSNKKVMVKCPICGATKSMTISNLTYYGFSCPSCGDKISYPEKLIWNVLNQIIPNQFKRQWRPEWCKFQFRDNQHYQGIYDFYIPFLNCIIETDGGWHKSDNKLSGQTEEESIYIDNQKDIFAKQHGINVIRINCEISDLEYIKNNFLNHPSIHKYFTKDQLNKINWIEADRKSQKSLMVEACILFDNGFGTTAKIADKLDINKDTVKNYLKRGVKNGLCKSYNPKEEQRKCLKIGRELSKKSVILLNTLQQFKSITYASIKTNTNISSISACCNHKRKSAGKDPITGEKYIWMFYDEWLEQQKEVA